MFKNTPVIVSGLADAWKAREWRACPGVYEMLFYIGDFYYLRYSLADAWKAWEWHARPGV